MWRSPIETAIALVTAWVLQGLRVRPVDWLGGPLPSYPMGTICFAPGYLGCPRQRLLIRIQFHVGSSPCNVMPCFANTASPAALRKAWRAFQTLVLSLILFRRALTGKAMHALLAPGITNLAADALSREHQPGQTVRLPTYLSDVSRTDVSSRTRAWWLAL